MADELIEPWALANALKARMKSITPDRPSGYSMTLVDERCALFAAAGRLRDRRSIRVNALWVRDFFKDTYKAAERGDNGARLVVEVVEDFLRKAKKGAKSK